MMLNFSVLQPPEDLVASMSVSVGVTGVGGRSPSRRPVTIVSCQPTISDARHMSEPGGEDAGTDILPERPCTFEQAF